MTDTELKVFLKRFESKKIKVVQCTACGWICLSNRPKCWLKESCKGNLAKVYVKG